MCIIFLSFYYVLHVCFLHLYINIWVFIGTGKVMVGRIPSCAISFLVLPLVSELFLSVHLCTESGKPPELSDSE